MQSFRVSTFAVSTDDERLFLSTDDSARTTRLKALYQETFGKAPEHTTKAGGRVNLIGEHVDYPDVQFAGKPPVHLFSMGGSIQNNYIVAAGRRVDSRVIVVQLECLQRMAFDLADLESMEELAESERSKALPKSERKLPSWTVHTLGAIKEMVNRGVSVSGLNLLLSSNVPHGAGMSNSAANCVALGLAFNELFPALALQAPIDLVTFARQSENSRFAGGHCGWLDQLLIVNSKAGELTKIDYAGNGIEHFESKLPEHMQFVAYNTNVPHVLAESDYVHRVRELTLGVTFLSARLGRNVGGPSLRLGTINALIAAMDPSIDPVNLPGSLNAIADVEGEAVTEFDKEKVQEFVAAVDADFEAPQDLPMHVGKSARESFAIILRRMRHQKMSSLLVPLAGEAASLGDAELFGLLLDMEGQSLRMSGDFMITGDNGAQDSMLDCAFEAGKNLGLRVHGRMLGGGGGGNVLLFADKSDQTLFEAWERDTIAAYDDWAENAYPGQNIRGTVIAPVISGGPERLDP